MVNKEVWIVFTKSEPLDGCSIDIDGCDFYFTEAYVPVESKDFNVTSLEPIVSRAKQSLLDDKLVLVDVSKCLRYREEEWLSNSEMDKEVHVLAAKALSSGTVRFGGFRSEEIEELCRYHHSMNELNT